MGDALNRKERENTPDVSVIVPVCNVERYLEECLDGLHEQTLGKIEILLVDDGSKDSCPQILAGAAAVDARMRVITKPNGGYGSAVNEGLSQARGRYVGIVEPDDRVDMHMYEELLALAALPGGGEADVVKSSYWEYYDLPGGPPRLEEPNQMKMMPKQPFVSTVYREFMVLFHHPSIWSAIYKREFLEQNGIRMMEVPGGGWVDNLFFFETLLQAEQFVWTPAAYYYYRQTNPDASSKLKDYHLPYDRLRDLRRLFERLHVTDPQIIACLYARHFFYTNTVIGSSGFAESDPELQELIHEAMAELDPKILYGGYRGIHRGYLYFYESVMGDAAERIRAHGPLSERPKISVIMPVCDERHGLPGTLNDLAGQTLDDCEVICVDCASEDVSLEILKAFEKKDARFRAIHLEQTGRSAGLKAGLAAATAPVLAVMLPGQSVPREYLEQAVCAADAGAEIVISVKGEKLTWEPAMTGGTFLLDGQRAGALLCASENLSGCVFRTDLLRSAQAERHIQDDQGLILLLDAVCAAKKGTLCHEHVPELASGIRLSARNAILTDEERLKDDLRCLDAAHRRANELGGEARQAFCCLAVNRLLKAMQTYPAQEQLYDRIRQAWEERYGISELPRIAYCNMEEYLTLERMFTSPYHCMLESEVTRLRKENRKMDQESRLLKESASYRIGRRVVAAGRRLLHPVTHLTHRTGKRKKRR